MLDAVFAGIEVLDDEVGLDRSLIRESFDRFGQRCIAVAS